MSGHGHVVPNEDGSRARCGGPTICQECALEAAQLDAQAERMRKHAVPMRSDEAAFPAHALSAFGAYEQATIALRDAELALKAAQETYRRALEALNKAIAPFPGEAK